MNNDNISYENDEELKLIVKKVALMLDLSYEHENTSGITAVCFNFSFSDIFDRSTQEDNK